MKLFLVSALIGILSVQVTCDCTDKILVSEYDALKALFYATDGPNWKWQTDSSTVGSRWFFPNNSSSTPSDIELSAPCGDPWQGLTCYTCGLLSCCVGLLELPKYNLAGSVPSSLSTLQHLEVLDLGSNSIHGKLPAALQNMTALTLLDLSANSFSGAIPSELGKLVVLRELYLDHNAFTGIVPFAIGNWSEVEVLYLDNNELTGSLPSDIGNIRKLKLISVTYNSLTGTLPSTLNALSGLNQLYLDKNDFSGSVPANIGDLQFLQYIYLFDNKFTGSLPAAWTALARLEELSIATNYFTSSLPSQFSAMTALTEIDVATNFYSGSLPSGLSALTKVQKLLLMANFFTGTIPLAICELPALFEAYFHQNLFSGPLPENLNQCTSIFQLFFYSNFLTGPIPSSVGGMSNLTKFYSYDNSLTGRLPTELGQLSRLQFLNIGFNRFSGSIPSQLFQIFVLAVVNLNNNLLTGSIPVNASTCEKFNTVVLNSNYFTGTVPSDFGTCAALEQLYVNDNLLVGTLPVDLRNLSLLLALQVNSNSLTGDLSNYFVSKPQEYSQKSSFRELQLLDFSDNQFVGAFPNDVFGLPALDVFSASSNCFSGSLACPQGVTGHDRVTVLDLNGLSSGAICREYLVSRELFPEAGYVPRNFVSGGVPSCFWNFSRLETLFLVGNGLTGPLLQGEPTLPRTLRNLSVAFNALTGSIPAELQEKANFLLVDLSFNLFSGTLIDSLALFNEQTVVNISVNRLSGVLPGVNWSENANLVKNVLNGNLLSFPLSALTSSQQSDAILADGSYVLDISMAISSPIIVAIAVVLTVLVRFDENNCPEILQPVLRSWFVVPKLLLRDYRFSISAVFWSGLVALAGMVFVGVACAVLKTSSSFALYSVQFTWVISTAFLKGFVPVIIIVITLMALVYVGAYFGIVWSRLASPTKNLSNPEPSYHQKSALDVGMETITDFAVLTINVVLMIGLNVFYLWCVLHDNPDLFLVQIFVATTKLMWNSLSSGLLTLLLLLFSRSSAVPYAQQSRLIGKHVTMRFVMQVFNFVVAPCIATALVEENCFLSLFKREPAPPINSFFCPLYFRSYTGVGVYDCVGPLLSLSSSVYEPPFTYGFQCGSALITNYVPVLLYAYFLSGFIFPFVLLPSFIWVTQQWPDIFEVSPWLACIFPKSLQRPPFLVISLESLDSGGEWPLIELSNIVARQLMSVVVLLSFGMSFFYLGAVILSSMFLEISCWMFVVGRFFLFATANSDYTNESNGDESQQRILCLEKRILVSLEPVWQVQTLVLILGLFTIFAFWGLLSFDMVASVFGVINGIVAVVTIAAGVPILILLLVFPLYNSRSAAMESNQLRGSSQKQTTEQALIIDATVLSSAENVLNEQQRYSDDLRASTSSAVEVNDHL